MKDFSYQVTKILEVYNLKILKGYRMLEAYNFKILEGYGMHEAYNLKSLNDKKCLKHIISEGYIILSNKNSDMV
jgi:hypothetical protein